MSQITSYQLYSLSNEISFIVFSCIICKIIDPFMPSSETLTSDQCNLPPSSNLEEGRGDNLQLVISPLLKYEE